MVDPRINPGSRIGLNFKLPQAVFSAFVVALVFLAGCMDVNDPSRIQDGRNDLSVALAVSDGTYRIVAVHSGKCVDVAGKSTADGANIQQWTCGSSTNQQFRLKAVATGVYNLTAVHSGKCVDVYKAYTADKTNIQQWSCNGNSNQRWKTVDMGSGQYELVAMHSGKCMDVSGVSTADGANIWQYGCRGNSNQKFYLKPVTTGNTAPSITSQPSSKTVSVGGSATFTVSASGTSPLTYQWQRASSGSTTYGSISGATSASYTRSNIQSSDNGSKYRCVVKNAYGTATSSAATLSVGVSTSWSKANLTWFTSYAVPGSDECNNYNGCEYWGMFAALPDKMSEDWVKAHNIVAVHEKDFSKYKLKTLRIKQGTRQIDAVVYDMCADSDCDGCCTRNAQENGLNFLLDLESYTKQRFGSGSGIVEWTCLNCN